MSTQSNGSTSTSGSLSGGPQPMAGLSGVQSGMGTGGPGITLGSNSSGIPDGLGALYKQLYGSDPYVTGSSQYQFTMPTSSGPNTQKLQTALATGAGDLSVQQNPQVPHATGSGKVSTRAEDFTPGLLDAMSAGGTNSGNTLIQMLQKYKVGA